MLERLLMLKENNMDQVEESLDELLIFSNTHLTKPSALQTAAIVPLHHNK